MKFEIKYSKLTHRRSDSFPLIVITAPICLALSSCDLPVRESQIQDIASDYEYDDSELRSRIATLEEENELLRNDMDDLNSWRRDVADTTSRNNVVLENHMSEYRTHTHGQF